MATAELTKPKFKIPTRSEEEWGEFFCDTTRMLFLGRSAGSGATVEDAIRGAAMLTEQLIELSENQ